MSALPRSAHCRVSLAKVKNKPLSHAVRPLAGHLPPSAPALGGDHFEPRGPPLVPPRAHERCYVQHALRDLTFHVLDEPRDAYVAAASSQQLRGRIGASYDKDDVRLAQEDEREDMVDEPDRTVAVRGKTHVPGKDEPVGDGRDVDARAPYRDAVQQDAIAIRPTVHEIKTSLIGRRGR